MIGTSLVVAALGIGAGTTTTDHPPSGERTLHLFSVKQAGVEYWKTRYWSMKKYARKQERLRSVQMVEIRKIRALIPQPFWVPSWFRSQALCVHHYEGSWDNQDTGHNGHYGGMQFAPSTWAGVGGRGNPANASPAEQIYRAYLVWKRDGGSWREWTTAGMCGL